MVLISAFGSLETALEAVKAGAFDFVSKPVDIGQVREVVERALARRASGGRRGAGAVLRPPACARRPVAAAARCSPSTSRSPSPARLTRRCW
ncbi:MAG: hypothetical protein U0599_15350 [Vicinamibacteria bacterium]